MRVATVNRTTRETDITITLNLDGSGIAKCETGIGFFDHMLDAFARFALMDLTVIAKGDAFVDAHHTVEDVGIVLGQALLQAAGDKKGMTRTAHAFVPMDEALAFAALDFCGRSYLRFDAHFSAPMCGQMDTQLCEEFLRALCQHAGLTLHIDVKHGKNDHHIMEAVFKAFGKALGDAMKRDERIRGVHSTKGALGGIS